jgi:hypothetical protein
MQGRAMSVIVHESLRLEALAENLGLPEGPVAAAGLKHR